MLGRELQFIHPQIFFGIYYVSMYSSLFYYLVQDCVQRRPQ